MNIRPKIMAVGLALVAAVLALAAANWRSTSDEAVRARFFAHRADFDIGNFNYGATGAVFGYSMSTLSHGAVFARMFTKNFYKHPNFTNDPHKDEMIRQGMQYYKNNCWN
jgi:hypothetical protein